MENINKKVFVTGANGMLGSSLVRALLSDGYGVRALIYPGTQTKTLEGLEVEMVSGDLTQDLPLDALLEDCSFVIHAAASTTIWPKRSRKIWDNNVAATRKLANAAKRANIARFVHIGTANSFALGTKDNPGTEEGSFVAHKHGLDYIDSKYAIQNELLAMHKKDGFPVIIVNPTFMIGPFDSGPTSGRMILAMMKGKLTFYGSGGRNFVYSGDVARAATNALTKGRSGECYLGAGPNLSYKEFAQMVNEAVGNRFILLRAPYLLTLFIGALLSVIARLTGKPPELSYTMARMSSESNFYRADKAIRELDMPETPLPYAVRDCIQWFKDNGYV